MARPVAVEGLRNGIDGASASEHADFHRADIEVAEHRIDLRADEVCRHVVDAENRFGVLRGQRRDYSRAINAKRRERFQIRRNAGAAARIEARDGDGDGGAHAWSLPVRDGAKLPQSFSSKK